MTVTLELRHEIEAQIAAQAQAKGLSVPEFLQTLIESLVAPKAPTARELLALPLAERDRILAAQAEDAAPLYEADLTRPIAERELTAFTALDGEPIYDDE